MNSFSATFAELIDRGSLIVNDGYRTKATELGESGIAILRVAEVSDGSITPTSGDRIREEYRSAIGQKLSQPGDILLTTKGTVGRRAIVPKNRGGLAYSPQLCFFRVIDESIDRRWLYYWLGGAEFWAQATRVATQTDMAPYISLRDLRAIRVSMPPLAEQRGIAATLGALDDKFESNRRLGALLWKLSDAMAEDLLTTRPTRLVQLSDVVFFNQLTMRPGLPNETLQYLDIASVSPGRIDLLQPMAWSDAPSRARRGVSDGDVIYSTVRPGRRSFALLIDPPREVVASTGFAIMTPRPAIGSSLLTTVVGSFDFAAYLESVAHGSAYPAAGIEAMGKYKLRIPDDEKNAIDFEASTMPLRRRAAQAELEIEKLESLRDTLLPELLSGRIRVPEAAAVVEEVAI